MKPPLLTLNQIAELGEPCYRACARAEWTDRNQHVNMRYYAALFDDAGDAFYPAVGLGGPGTMDLEHHTHFLRELRADDEIAVFIRLVGVSTKRFHYLMFLIDQSTDTLAAIFECVCTFVDLKLRRAAPLPENVREALESLRHKHAGLSWPAPVCGVMSA